MRSLLPVLCLLVTVSIRAQPRPHALQQQRLGPWDNDLLIASSKDGLIFEKPTIFTERGGVPHVARDSKNRLVAVFQWFPFDKAAAFDKVAVRISADNGKTWTDPEPIRVKDLPPGYQRPFDPTLVLLEDGRLRLYFTCTTPDRRTPAIYSAIGSAGDVVEYTFEAGMRLGVDNEPVIDCAAVRIGKTLHLYSPVQRADRAYHAVSDDGLTFKRLDDVSIEDDPAPDRRWLGCALATGDGGGIRFYGTGGRGQGWSAFSKDGQNWKLDPTTRGLGADPGVACTADGNFVVISTGPPRADAGQRRPPARP